MPRAPWPPNGVGRRADSHTLLWGPGFDGRLADGAEKCPLSDLAEFVPVVNVVQFSFAMFANKDLPFKTFAGLLPTARPIPASSIRHRIPGRIYGSTQVLDAVGVKGRQGALQRGRN